MRNNKIQMALILGITTLAAGCAVGPDYVRPKIDAPATFKEAQGWKQAQPKDDQPHGAWWEIYADSELNTLLRQASKYDCSGGVRVLGNANLHLRCASAK